MKCIDAIEGHAKAILQSLHSTCLEGRADDSEYVREMKAIIEGTNAFLTANPEIVEGPQLLLQELYQYSRTLWLKSLTPPDTPPQDDKVIPPADSDEEYETYYYDYLYHRGLYPR